MDAPGGRPISDIEGGRKVGSEQRLRLKAFGERIMARDPDRQTAEIVRVA